MPARWSARWPASLLLKVIQNLINQVGTLDSYYQQLVSGMFLLVVVMVQA